LIWYVIEEDLRGGSTFDIMIWTEGGKEGGEEGGRVKGREE
jgi:hypothetical protein